MLERLRAFNRWTRGWAGSIAVAVGIWIVLRSYLIEAFRIPSASMENTLLVGDFLFVNKAIYGGELEIPLTGLRCCRLPGYAEPHRDGIVVFRSVEDSTPNLNIVKRVIGGPTDTLQMRRDTVYRNGKALDEPLGLPAHLAVHVGGGRQRVGEHVEQRGQPAGKRVPVDDQALRVDTGAEVGADQRELGVDLDPVPACRARQQRLGEHLRLGGMRHLGAGEGNPQPDLHERHVRLTHGQNP